MRWQTWIQVTSEFNPAEIRPSIVIFGRVSAEEIAAFFFFAKALFFLLKTLVCVCHSFPSWTLLFIHGHEGEKIDSLLKLWAKQYCWYLYIGGDFYFLPRKWLLGAPKTFGSSSELVIAIPVREMKNGKFRAGSKISRPKWETAGNRKKIATIHLNTLKDNI